MNSSLKIRFFVVIHTVSSENFGLDHVLSQTKIAKNNGADGIFIIPDYAKGSELKATTADQFSYLKSLQENFPDFLIGVNFLVRLSEIVPDIYSTKPSLLQTDGASFSGIQKDQLPTTEFFCGVAFKYSKYETVTGDELREHCLSVANLCDVPTTSGKATGISASQEKIKEIVMCLPQGKRLGLASGVSIDNVEDYLRAGVTDFLVATSLVSHVDELGRDILSPESISMLATKIHSY